MPYAEDGDGLKCTRDELHHLIGHNIGIFDLRLHSGNGSTGMPSTARFALRR
jgi:hypothetical protein